MDYMFLVYFDYHIQNYIYFHFLSCNYNYYWALLLNSLYDAWKPIIDTLTNFFMTIYNAASEIMRMVNEFLAQIQTLMDGLDRLVDLLGSIWEQLSGILKLVAEFPCWTFILNHFTPTANHRTCTANSGMDYGINKFHYRILD